MDMNERRRISILHVVVGAILFAVCFWDIFAVQVHTWPYYFPFKITVIGIYFAVAFFVHTNRMKPTTGMDLSTYTFYIYSYVCTVYLHPTYIFSFYEGLTFISFYYSGSVRRYSAVTLFGVVLAFLSVSYMPEPAFVKPGHSIREHLHTITGVFGILSFVIFWFFNRAREIIYQKDQKFSSIGRQSAFLLHELKSPLSRFMMSNSQKDNRDAEYILSIVEGVELLITKKENLLFGKLQWKDIESYLRSEFSQAIGPYDIQLEVTGFEGEGFGHRSAIKLALKNLVKNAVEAIVLESKKGVIKVTRSGNTIEVSNNGSVINKEKLDLLFRPFYSDKASGSNFGIGLHFVESVVNAHNGKISVNVENGWNTFKLNLGEVT